MIDETKMPDLDHISSLKELANLISVIKRALKRVRKKLEKQEKEYNEAKQFERFSSLADSLISYPDKYPRGTAQCQVENVHTEVAEQVNLNPALDAIENARELYKKARKGKRGVEIIREKLAASAAEMAGLDNMANSLARFQAPDTPPGEDMAVAVEQAKSKLQDMGVLPREKKPKEKTEAETVPFRHMTLDGYDIYIGKNDEQNDELTTRFAKPWDLWMHVAAHSGSHVVIRRDKNSPWPEKNLLLKAASLAVWFSKAKHTSYAEVHVAEARYVHKRRHAPAGQVIMQQYKTLRVSPKSPQDYFGGDYDK
jgi:predicted ribosome quality control (RQC) complex YloA/Tae2 family protein